MQSGDGPGGVGTLKVLRYVSDSVAWDAEPRHQGVEEVRGGRRGHDKVDFAPAQAQAAQEAPARFLGAVSQASRVTGLIRTRTFAEFWVHPGRLTAEISEFLDRVWADDEPRDRDEIS